MEDGASVHPYRYPSMSVLSVVGILFLVFDDAPHPEQLLCVILPLQCSEHWTPAHRTAQSHTQTTLELGTFSSSLDYNRTAVVVLIVVRVYGIQLLYY